MNLFKSIITHNMMLRALGAIMVQQTLVALGTYLIGRLAVDIANGQFNILIALSLFFSATTSGSLAHYFVTMLTTKANKQLFDLYLEKYIAANYNKPLHWRASQAKTLRHDVMLRSGPDAIQSAVYFVIDVVSTSLNVVFNTISVFFVTNSVMAAAIVFAGLIGVVIVKRGKNKIASATDREFASEAALTAHLAKSWDNIVLGNSLFFKSWFDKYKQIFGSNLSASLNNAHVQSLYVSLAAFVTTGLVLGTVIGLAYWSSATSPLIVGLIVMLPRSLQIVSHIQIIQSYLVQWQSLKQRLHNTEMSLITPEERSVDKFIKKDEIVVSGSGAIYKVDDFIAQALSIDRGRFTIRGNNGSGKTSLLMQIKEQLGSSMSFVPIHHQLELQGVDEGLSSGEKALAVIRFLSEQAEGALLLDEWDANLSAENRIMICKELDRISQYQLVIEVRHGSV